MSDTPRNDDTPEYRDPTAPSDPRPERRARHSDGRLRCRPATHSPIETNQTQDVPPVPPGPVRRHRHRTHPPRRAAEPARGQPTYGPPPGPRSAEPVCRAAGGAGARLRRRTPTASAPGAGQPEPLRAPAVPDPGPGARVGYAGGAARASARRPTALRRAPAATGVCRAPVAEREHHRAAGRLGPDHASAAASASSRLVFAIIAATKKDQPADSAKYTRWGWIAFVVGLVLVSHRRRRDHRVRRVERHLVLVIRLGVLALA